MKATATQQQGMRIIPYTPKSFAVIGDTYTHRAELKSMGGCFSKWLKIDNANVPGWCFSLKRELEVRRYLMGVESPRPAPKDKRATPKATKKAKAPKAVKEPTEKAETPCSKERVARALAGEPMSAYHWAMRHVLESGLRPSEVAAGTGLWGTNRSGMKYGESERKSVFWMLKSNATAADIACCEDCPEYLRAGASPQLFWDIVTEFAGPGGKGRMVEKCIALAESTVMTPECPF